ncbi:MAG: recombinase family protein [Rhodobiaceae bacterium]|nr:recombinase family protein [Rhodobiaceae bacterium]
MLIGYARVSTEEQNLDLQYHSLRKAGCAHIYSDKASGALSGRKGLRQAIRRCREGDVLVVWKLDRLGRSLIDLVSLVERLNARGIGLRVLTGQGAMIDTSRPEGRMIFGIFAALAEFERELIRERTLAGMAAARKRGAVFGRPRKLTDTQIAQAREWLDKKTKTPTAIARQFEVHVTTLKRSLEK